MVAKGAPFTETVRSAVTVAGDTTTVTVPWTLTVSAPRVTLKSIVSVASFASGVASVSCSATLTAGLSRLQVTSIWASGLSVVRFVAENDALNVSGRVPSVTEPTAGAVHAVGGFHSAHPAP